MTVDLNLLQVKVGNGRFVGGMASGARKYYANSRAKKTAESRQRCELSEPSITVTSVYLKVLQERILSDAAGDGFLP